MTVTCQQRMKKKQLEEGTKDTSFLPRYLHSDNSHNCKRMLVELQAGLDRKFLSDGDLKAKIHAKRGYYWQLFHDLRYGGGVLCIVLDKPFISTAVKVEYLDVPLSLSAEHTKLPGEAHVKPVVRQQAGAITPSRQNKIIIRQHSCRR